MSTACPRCQADAPGRVIVVEEDQHDRLRALLTGGLAHEVCPSCEEVLATEPTVIVVFAETREVLFVAGSQLGDPDALTGDLLHAYLPAGAVPSIVRCPGQPQLREQVRRRLATRLAPVRALLDAGVRGEQWRHFADHWAELTPAVVAAAGIAATCPDEVLALGVTGAETGRLMGLDPLLDPSAHPRATVDNAVAGLLIRGWLALGADWSAGSRAGSLDHDLRAYIRIEALPAGGRDLIPVIFEPQAGDRYVRAAVQAAAAHAAGVENPQASQWALLYFGFELALRRRPDDPVLLARRVPASLAAATIDHRAAWDAVSQSLSQLLADRPLSEAAALVQEIAEQAGHPGVPAAVVQENAVSPHEAAEDAETMLARAMPPATDVPLPAVLAALAVEVRSQPDDRRPIRLDEVAELLQQRCPGDLTRIVVWWADRHVVDGRPDRADAVLRRLPDGEPPDPATRARLLGVRAQILAGRGAAGEAIGLWVRAEAAADETGDVKLRHWTRVNRAILLRETDPDQALELLTDAVYGPDRYEGDHPIFGLLATLRQRRGELDAAIDLLEQAEHLAQGPAAARYALQRCQLLIARRREAEALPILADLTAHGGPADVPALIAESNSWAMLLARGLVPAELTGRAHLLPQALAANAERARELGNRADFLRLTAARADFQQTTGDPAAAELWERLVELRAGYGVAPEPQELAESARVRLARGDRAGMRELLVALPAELARRYGAAPDLVPEPRRLLRPLAETAGLLVDVPQQSAADLRLIGELQRDAVGRARAARRNARPADEPAWSGTPDPRIAGHGPVAVVEWIQTGDRRLRCLLTTVDAGGSQARWLSLPQLDPKPVQTGLLTRLQGWTASRPGDPFDDPGWRSLSGHLVDQLADHLGAADHVVFLHHEAYANLPWHTAIRGRWTVSYAAGWTHLADLVRRPPAARERLGICHVPHADEDPATRQAFLAASDHLAALPEIKVTTGDPAAADRGYLTGLMAGNDVVVLLCHGFRAEETEDVGLELAADGLLPPAGRAAAKRRPQHRFGWREARLLDPAAPTVFSAACSTAHSYGAGLGDRLGLASALRPGGTTALVAPPWDVLGVATLPVLRRAAELYLTGAPLARALRAAAQDAAASGPDWLVWSLALEGDWR